MIQAYNNIKYVKECFDNGEYTEEEFKGIISKYADQDMFAIDNQIDLTIVGPEASLMNGICDLFKEKGLKIFGPTKDAALIEGSKEFAKDIMTKYLIPTAKYGSFDDYEEALAYVEREGTPIVINSWRKPIGLPMGWKPLFFNLTFT